MILQYPERGTLQDRDYYYWCRLERDLQYALGEAMLCNYGKTCNILFLADKTVERALDFLSWQGISLTSDRNIRWIAMREDTNYLRSCD